MFKRAFRENMLYKIQRYTDLLQRSELAVSAAMDVINIKMPALKVAAGLNPTDVNDNWNIFDTISTSYQAATDQASQFRAIINRARDRLSGTMSVDKVMLEDTAKELRDDLVYALEHLSNFSAQSHIVINVVDIVSSFIKDPRLFRTKLMNFILMGGAGTGKTTIAEAIGDVFAKAGMFVGNSLIEGGRGELVGQYMGETVFKTRSFLTGNLDKGVIFIDEAYGITPWEDGKPESYGTEAATAMVEFMSRYQGLYCIIIAGYERDMTRYFLPTNEGLSRRFPNKFLLTDMTGDEMIVIFKRQLLRAQGLPVPNGSNHNLVSDSYFTTEAVEYLRRLFMVCTQGDVSHMDEFDSATRRTYKRVRCFRPSWEYMYQVFEHQAGSMTNLADEAITVLYTTITFEEVFEQRKRGRTTRPCIRDQGVDIMRRVIIQRIMNMSFSDSDMFLKQLLQVEQIL